MIIYVTATYTGEWMEICTHTSEMVPVSFQLRSGQRSKGKEEAFRQLFIFM